MYLEIILAVYDNSVLKMNPQFLKKYFFILFIPSPIKIEMFRVHKTIIKNK